MLCQFSVENFQCLKNKTILDMQATSISELKSSLLIDADNEQFLPLSVIYGPNGAGKSTVLLALYSLACKVMRPICAATSDSERAGCTNCTQLSDNTLIRPFKYSREMANVPTVYELFFRTNTNEYQYRLSVLKSKVLNEELYKKSLTGKRYSTVFIRKGTANITLKGSLKSFICSDISDNLPLLSYLGITHRRNSLIKDVINWFENDFRYIDYGLPMEEAIVHVARTGEMKDLVLQMLCEMDIDIMDYRMDESKENKRLMTKHQVDGKEYELELSDESSGTIKLFSILPFIAESIKRGTTLVVDELDAKLHPMLLQYIIGLYNNPQINKKKAQLIFTSHDLSTMNSSNFRRDEIWFIARGDDLSSKLYSLVEFKNDDGTSERKDARYDKRYLEGRYGADPYLRRIIEWGDSNARW